MSLEKTLEAYDYKAPTELIAQSPVSPRDKARLMVCKRNSGVIAEDIFSNLNRYLPPRSLLVINDTKVIPARLLVSRQTGGRVEILCLSFDGRGITALSNKKLTLGEELALKGGDTMRVESSSAGIYLLAPSFSVDEARKVLEREGHTPLPPYIKHTPLREEDLRREYQSVFALRDGSVAAPTASLHFTSELMKQLGSHGHSFARLTLHVGLGTFAPLREEALKSGHLHKERFEISKETAELINIAKSEGRTVLAVGTTVMRALETAASYEGVTATQSETDMFIRPGYEFKIVDALITNFHVPRSSLLMLVAAFLGEGIWRDVYERAIQERFRLFSFGDAMLIL